MTPRALHVEPGGSMYLSVSKDVSMRTWRVRPRTACTGHSSRHSDLILGTMTQKMRLFGTLPNGERGGELGAGSCQLPEASRAHVV
ncbi:hypothetical protein N7532_004232 [Penicillium argentinense]|uniref:Uncharacterized protein n=1 Tax=Penicillium argentinense TaxID=1131581 RepID=A0A9W9FP04_9EURO|nr:uncharacterized protein N7532_004232 [Penicillium argentinense]KAJ5103703.1 hypothetical protein N7532_004232 [Penicillium argentinense]